MEMNNKKVTKFISLKLLLVMMGMVAQNLSAQNYQASFEGQVLHWDYDPTYSFITNWNLNGAPINTMIWGVATGTDLGRTAMKLHMGTGSDPATLQDLETEVPKYLEIGNVQDYNYLLYGNTITEAKILVGQAPDNPEEGYLGTANNTQLGIGVGGNTDIGLSFESGIRKMDIYSESEFHDIATFFQESTFSLGARFDNLITLSGLTDAKLKFEADGMDANYMEFYGGNTQNPQRMGYIGFGSGANNDLYVSTDQGDNIRFLTKNAKRMQIDTTGMVYIGSNNYAISSANQSDYKLWVEKGVVSEDFVLAPNTAWADFVFEEGYPLLPLKTVDEYIKNEGHLPEMPSAEIIYKEGYSTAEMNQKFMMKIEELTLYTIQQEKEIEKLKAALTKQEDLQKRLELLETKLNAVLDSK